MTVLLKLLRFVTEHQRWWQLNYNWAPQQVYTLDLFLINYLSISLSPAVSLTHRAKSRGNAPVHQAEEKEQFSGSLWVIFKQSAPAVCTCFLLHKQTPDWLWHTHTHFSLTSYRLCTSHCSGEHLASCCFVEAFTEPEVACGLCASTELRLIVRRCSESERQRRSQHETRSPAHSHHSPVTESAEQRLKAAAGEHLTPPCRHEPVPPYTGGANSAEARGKHAPWGPSFHDFKLI